MITTSFSVRNYLPLGYKGFNLCGFFKSQNPSLDLVNQFQCDANKTAKNRFYLLYRYKKFIYIIFVMFIVLVFESYGSQ